MYQAGWSRQDIGITPRGFGMQGYGNWHQKDQGQNTPLYARALVLGDGAGPCVMLCCLDLGYVTHAMREGVCAVLARDMGDAFDADRLILTCTHTHSGPGGCSHDIMYNIVTPGFVPEYLERIVAAASGAILAAWRQAAPARLELREGGFAESVDVAWNRSRLAYNRNPEVVPRAARETHLALDRRMQVLSLHRGEAPGAVVSLFGVHATCIGRTNRHYDGDNKGYAAAACEQALRAEAGAGAAEPVAIFAQSTAGDVSPHYHGPGQRARRAAISGERNMPMPPRMAMRRATMRWRCCAMKKPKRSAAGSTRFSAMWISPPSLPIRNSRRAARMG